ncbi:phosphoglucomutase (alpha-D-glucose-1,6-bisphosphate-dependent) [Coralloluteibacterium stylophorae]|uniref:Phosphoglucomutase n=1 Tax=Coralloluteibacterium stylophorae TaxID=1776034 RepID=A0A8J8AZL3_9GAMM|nr:phosphoglucomutase (alpha-D-glucose-1,6-bisphosphate-dependent) [Coralloluteibacterium stylophorae]MBS7455590.1 phosphoglucomutase (alpha-D-glucose-1,6-bisphosphate-dependent) [Coralloluteibacterium stylophorae]
MSIHPRAGQLPQASDLVDLDELEKAYYAVTPDAARAEQQIAFGTSGHRGSSLRASFNEAHILAVTQAVCDYRRQQGIDGPLYIGRDTHALSGPALRSAVEVLVANEVEVRVDGGSAYTPTPAVSHAILVHNRGRRGGLADGIVITPSHNPPADGGFKYDPTTGGPAEAEATKAIQARANALIAQGLREVRRTPWERAQAGLVRHDVLGAYVEDLGALIDMDAIRGAGLKLGVDPLGGAGIDYWPRIAERYGLDLTVTDATVDGTFRFMPLDWDGKIRMDPSSRHAMAQLLELRDRFDVAFGCDTDHDRHGIVAPSVGLLPSNHFLAVCVDYLFRERGQWREAVGIGKTAVSSAMIDRVAADLGRGVVEVPAGFKWFVGGLLDGSLGFAGEESAGATLLRRDGGVWTTDKDGIALGLLAAEITARRGRDPGEVYAGIEECLGRAHYARIDAPASAAERAAIGKLSSDAVTAGELAGDTIESVLTHAPGNDAALGGIKVSSAHGWFAARPSGTEDIYKIYAESFRDAAHLARIQEEARAIVGAAIGAA